MRRPVGKKGNRSIVWSSTLAAFSFWVSPAVAGPSFVNWENAHVHPLDVTPNESLLLAVNTPDNRLEVFDLSTGAVVPIASVSVGLDPVSVRARTNTEAWVVNHISDSVSVVDLTTMNVVVSIPTDDEPADVVFAGSPQRAFVSCSQANTVLVIDPADPTAAPVRILIEGEDPRAMAVNADGSEVYVAIFESGNRTTILGGGSVMGGGFPPNVVNDAAGPYAGVNPPPNDGPNFNPPQGDFDGDGSAGEPAPPQVGLIVRKDGNDQWMDDNGGDWTEFVSGAQADASGRLPGWDLVDHDVAIIDTASLSVTYATGLMNICMALAVNPGNDEVTVVGTEATNEIRFEPVLTGRFLRVHLGRVDPTGPTTTAVSDLNTHLTYTTAIPFVPIPQIDRDRSIGDPRGIVWNSPGTRGYVTGMGSNNVIVIDAAGNRAGVTPTIEVGEGPTGVVLDEGGERLYVLNKFASTISVIDTASETELLPRVSFHDPSLAAIKSGRKHAYDTHRNSGLGQIACVSCHVDTRMDRLAWDLGSPSGSMKSFNQNCAPLNNCQDWHPMKGPMTTQTFQDIIGKEPHHWRGDRNGLEEFDGAFAGLQGDDGPLPPVDMQEFEDFLATIHFPPNPFRNFDNSLPTNLPLPGHFSDGRFSGGGGLDSGDPLPNGDGVAGLLAYRTQGLDGVQCVTCHTLPTGLGADGTFLGPFQPIPPGPNGERHHAIVSVDGSTNVSMKIPHLRNQYEKVGFDTTQLGNTAGFGLLHDGSVDSIARFVSEPVFNVQNDQQVADLVAFMLAFSGSDLPLGSPNNPLEPPGPSSRDTHAAVGWQTTLVDAGSPLPGQLALIGDMIALADTGVVGMVVKGVQGGEVRGYAYIGGGQFQSDRASEVVAAAALQA
ncbi:MAG: YncE family protein, partial [Planctomycetota bacterium]|nr:YncE family protein [Planctomycetota bacterium]